MRVHNGYRAVGMNTNRVKTCTASMYLAVSLNPHVNGAHKKWIPLIVSRYHGVLLMTTAPAMLGS